MNKKAIEFEFSKVIELLLFILFLIVMISIIYMWRTQSYDVVNRFLGIFR